MAFGPLLLGLLAEALAPGFVAYAALRWGMASRFNAVLAGAAVSSGLALLLVAASSWSLAGAAVVVGLASSGVGALLGTRHLPTR